MILKASQRGSARSLSNHLLNDRDNDHVSVAEIRGFMADNLDGAFQEAHAISNDTQFKQFLFSLSLNPPKDYVASEPEFLDATDKAKQALGLSGQPRAIVIHEKEGRRHAHVVWSKIDANELKAINLPFFKSRLMDVSRDLHLDHGWALPRGRSAGLCSSLHKHRSKEIDEKSSRKDFAKIVALSEERITDKDNTAPDPKPKMSYRTAPNLAPTSSMGVRRSKSVSQHANDQKPEFKRLAPRDHDKDRGWGR